MIFRKDVEFRMLSYVFGLGAKEVLVIVIITAVVVYLVTRSKGKR